MVALASSASAPPASTTTSTSNAHRTLVITLSSVLPVVGLLLLLGLGLACWRCRRRGALFARGISPIADDEIETWKVDRLPEKACGGGSAAIQGSIRERDGADTPPPDRPQVTRTRAMTAAEPESRSPEDLPAQRARGISLDSSAVVVTAKKSPSRVIIDDEPPMLRHYASTPFDTSPSWWKKHQQRRSEDLASPRTVRSARSLSLGQSARAPPMAGRFSLDQGRDRDQGREFALAQLSPQGLSLDTSMPAAVHARAPNSRTGLTDETIPGDPSFLPSPKPLRRQPSRLTKQPHTSGSHGHRPSQSGSSSTGGVHSFWNTTRTRSGRSSSNVSGRSVGSEAGLQHPPQAQAAPQKQDEEVPPLPLIAGQRSLSDLRDVAATGPTSDSISRSRAYLHHQHHRFYPSTTPTDDSDDGDDTFLGGLSPRPSQDRGNIGRAIG